MGFGRRGGGVRRVRTGWAWPEAAAGHDDGAATGAAGLRPRAEGGLSIKARCRGVAFWYARLARASPPGHPWADWRLPIRPAFPGIIAQRRGLKAARLPRGQTRLRAALETQTSPRGPLGHRAVV